VQEEQRPSITRNTVTEATPFGQKTLSPDTVGRETDSLVPLGLPVVGCEVRAAPGDGEENEDRWASVADLDVVQRRACRR
jgi:hypothetical protein